jgi:hypothetical protein
MPNLGLVMRLPATWTPPIELTDAQRGTLARIAPDVAQVLDDGWQVVRVGPGGDLGTLLVEPQQGMLFVGRWLDEADQELDLDGAMTEVAGRAPRDDELTPARLLGRDALHALLRETVGGHQRVRVLLVTRLADDRAATFSVSGPAATFDDAVADAAFASITETGDTPLGRPWRETTDPILGERLGALGYDQLLSGDLWTLIRNGGAQGSLLFRAAVRLQPAITAAPDRLRGARTGPKDTSGTGFAEVSAIRIEGEAEPDWATLDPAFAERGFAAGQVAACVGLVANPTIDGHAGALLVADGAAFLFEAPDLASVIAAAEQVIGC